MIITLSSAHVPQPVFLLGSLASGDFGENEEGAEEGKDNV